MTIEARGRGNKDEIDFSAVFAILWKRKMLIVFGTLAVTLLATALSFLIPKTFRSEGFYQLGNRETKLIVKGAESFIGIPIPLYKKSATQFFDSNRIQLLVRHEKFFTEKEQNSICKEFGSAEKIGRWIHPVYAYSREDVRQFAQVGKDNINSVIGLNLSYEAESPQIAQKYVRFFGNYIRDCLLYITLYDYIENMNLTARSKLNQIENNIIEIRFDLLQKSKKMADIKSILTRYPESARIENRQLVSVQEGGSRYLAPITQLVGIESTLADLRRALSQLERDKEMHILRSEYFSRCQEGLKNANEIGTVLLAMVKSVKADVFRDKDLSMDTVKEVFNSLSIDLQTFDLVFFSLTRFISGPTMPNRHIKPRKILIVIITFFLAAFFFVCLAFSLSWWHCYKQAILADSKKK